MAENIKNDTTVNDHHGAFRSYLLGLVLSLVFTIIPYYMVTRQIATGNALLLTILGFAVVQMFVQIFFFLHLGRGPKPLYNIVFFFATAGLIVLVVGASLIIMDNLYRNMSPQELTTRLAQEENIAELNGKPTGACQGNNANHTVIIKDNQVSTRHISAQLCDTLVLTNNDSSDREFVFNSQGRTVSYGGMYNIPVKGGRYKSITMNEIGIFSFRDSKNPEVTGHFEVEP